MKKTALALTALLWLQIHPGSCQADVALSPLRLTLKSAKAMAVENQSAVLIAQEQANEIGAQERETHSALNPSLFFQSYQVRQTENLKAMGFNFPGLPYVIGPFDTFDARVYFTQQIFNLAKARAVNAAEYAVKSTKLHADAIAQQVAGGAALAYVEFQRAQKTVAAAQANHDLSENLLKLAHDQQSSGMATGVDVVRAESVNTRNELILRQAKSDAIEADTRLHRALGISMDTPLELLDSLSENDGTSPDLKQSVQTAMDRRPELQALEQAIEEKEMERKAVEAERYPSLGLVGNFGSSAVTPSHYDYRTYSYGVQFSMPILDGGAIHAREDEAASRKRETELQLLDTRQQVEEDVRLSLTALNTSRDQVKTAEIGLQLAEKLMTQARDRFSHGLADNLEVVDAEASLAVARSQKINALAAYKMATINYQLATGQLDYSTP